MNMYMLLHVFVSIPVVLSASATLSVKPRHIYIHIDKLISILDVIALCNLSHIKL